MADRKVTFTLEELTRIGRLSERERERMLNVFDTLVPRIPARPQHEVEDELREIRRARPSGGRRSHPGNDK